MLLQDKVIIITGAGGGLGEGVHFVMATTNSPWAEMFMPAPGGPIISKLCPPAAATSSARFDDACPFTSEKSTV